MGPISRRELLKHTAVASAALATPQFLAESTAAEPTFSSTKSPSERLRVAVVGVRGRGKDHVKGLAGRHGCEVTVICDCDEASIGKAMKEADEKQGKTPKFVQDIRKVVEDPNIDIITVATPNHWHALASIWAMQNGKDVYVEKPVSHNVSEGRRIVETARKFNRICQTGTQCRSSRGLQEVFDFLHAGKLGKLRIARGLCFKGRGSIGKVKGTQPIPKTIDYDLWCGPAPKKPLTRARLHYDWHWIWDYGNGDLGNQGIHQMDLARWGLNKDALANSVFSVGGRFGYEDDGETANTQMALFDYGDSSLIFEVRGLGTKDWLTGYRDQPTKDKRKSVKVGDIFECDEGYVIITSYSNAVACTKDWEVVRTFGGGGDHYGNFIQAVRSRKAEDLNADIEEGHLSSALCHLANISLRLGTEQSLATPAKAMTDDAAAVETITRMQEHVADNRVELKKTMCMVGAKLAIEPEAERFIGNQPKANAMLSREYRKGYEVPAKV